MAELWKSIEEKNIPLLKEHLDGGADVNYREQEYGRMTCLMRAVLRGNKEVVSLLLQLFLIADRC